MKKNILSLILTLFYIGFSTAQNTCLEAIPICGSSDSVYPNNSTGTEAGENVDFGCVGFQPNPTWFYIPVATSGFVDFQIAQYRYSDGNLSDVDFVLWGPFNDVVCDASNLTNDNIVDCSYSASATENVIIPNASPGQIYMLLVTNFAGPAGYIEFTETTNTNFFDAISCTGFRFNAFLDENGNDIKDENEVSFPNGFMEYSINDGEDTELINSEGNFYVFENNDQNSYDFEFVIEDEFSAYYDIETPLIENQFITVNEITDYYFPIDVIAPYDDLNISITPLDSPNPGFNTHQQIVFQNLGSSTVASGTITYAFDPLTTYVSSTNPNTTQSENTLNIPFTDLAPFETRSIDITLNTNMPPEVSIDDVLTFTVDVTVDGLNDINPDNNSFELEVVVIGSYDPNDKLEAHAGEILISDFSEDDYLTYTIRFQNTGTAPAQNVVIKDFLTDEHDVNTLIMLSASHSYQLEKNGMDLEWEFRNINLSDSTNDEPNSHGYVTFKIKPTAGFTVDTVIENTAEIYFDFNEPIITNTMVTTFSNRLNIDDVKQSTISIYPNPTKDKLFITSLSELTYVEVTNVLGQILVSESLNTLETSLDLKRLPEGNYFISFHSEDKIYTQRIIKN